MKVPEVCTRCGRRPLPQKRTILVLTDFVCAPCADAILKRKLPFDPRVVRPPPPSRAALLREVERRTPEEWDRILAEPIDRDAAMTTSREYAKRLDAERVMQKLEQRKHLKSARDRKTKKKRTPKAVKAWITQRARQRDDEGWRYGARRIWEELCKSFDVDAPSWSGVADAPASYRETCAVVRGVRGRKAP